MTTAAPRLLLNWLLLACASVSLFGLLLVMAPAATRMGFSLLVYGNTAAIDAFGAEAARYAAMTHAVIGGVMVGWGVALFLIARTLVSRGSRAGWWMITASLLAWFVPDTSYSLLSGYWQNAVLNSAFGLLFAIPLALLRPYLRED